MKSKTKKIIIASASVALIGTVAIGTTMAYLTVNTNSKVNNFTFNSEAVKAILIEPKWDGIVSYDENNTAVYAEKYNAAVTAGTYETAAEAVAADEELGMNIAENMIPGKSAPKNPQVKNTGSAANGDVAEWVAVKVTYVYNGGTDAGKQLSTADMANLNNVIEIDYDDTGAWIKGDTTDPSSTIYYYNKQLDLGKTTTELFTEVKVKEGATKADLENAPNFSIKIEGYAAQADAYDDVTAFKADVTTF